MKSIVFELNDAARTTRDPERKALLKSMALLIDAAIDALRSSQTREAMTALNGYWAQAERILDEGKRSPGPGRGGALLEPARLAA